uniref:Putative conserved secreted protein n=2 Tax=Nyssomyia neivai TaxID=330878 RepID=A0A1L8DP86_9DIPT
MKWISVCMVIVFVVGVRDGALAGKGTTVIDTLRDYYLTLEDQAWKVVSQGKNPDRVLPVVYKLYKMFALQNITTEMEDYELISLDRIYEWKLLERDLMSVRTLFEVFRQELEKPVQGMNNFDELSATDFAETVFEDKNFPVPQTFDQIENIMVNQGLYYKAMVEVKDQVCSSQKAAQQVIYQMYSAISLTELKGYAMMQFSWMLLKTFGKGNYTQEAQIMRQRFENRTERTQELVKRVMERSELNVWRCDPDVHIEGETYEQFTRLLQGYIENEVDMNTDGTCKENCAAYTFTESHGCFKDLYCAQQPQCKGHIINCTYVDSDMWICPSKLHTNRRYEYIKYENGRVLGEESTCVRGTTKVDSWWRWLFWHCSYCLCLCDEQGYKSDRYFNLRETVSDIDNNRVIVGVRFRKVNRIMHLQIQQGELLPRGIINASTVEWKPINGYRLLDSGLKNGVDYHTMEWNKRAIDLDDLSANPGHLVTGVKFRSIGPRVNLEIRVQEFNFETGKLDKVGVWISNDNTEVGTNQRTRIYLKDPDIPTRSKARSQIDSKTNQFIEFTNTDINADAAQTTVPFLDAQDVVSVPPVPLSGIGIYHKGLQLSGGFVAPKIIVYNMAQHVYTPKPGQEDLWDTYG